jgi:hypothetical protein
VILGFYAGKSHNLIGLGIFHGDLDFFDLHEKSLDLSNYEIFPHKVLKSRTFKKSSILIVIRAVIGRIEVVVTEFQNNNLLLRCIYRNFRVAKCFQGARKIIKHSNSKKNYTV